jgi:predicted nucleic acid-binding protein
MGLIPRSGPIGLDTSVFIYYVEENASYIDVIAPIFEAADRGELQIVTSALTLLEILVIPFKRNDVRLASRYEALLTRSRSVRLVDVSRDQLRAAAYIRATSRIKTGDALQLAAAKAGGCSLFLTNDQRIPAIRGLRIVRLSDI